VAAEVVDFVGAVDAAKDHVGRRASRRRWVWQGGFNVPMVASTVTQEPDDLAIVIDVICNGRAVQSRIIDGGENAPAIEERVNAGGGGVSPDDLARIVDA